MTISIIRIFQSVLDTQIIKYLEIKLLSTPKLLST